MAVPWEKFGLVLRTNGSVFAWGSNLDGQLNVPANLSGVAAIDCGGRHSMALRNNGTVAVWGDCCGAPLIN